MKKRKPNNRKLSVYLIKKEFKYFESIVKDGIEGYEVMRNENIVGKLYIKSTVGHLPPWLSFFENSIQDDLKGGLKSSNVSAAFILPRNGRIFAITFGYGRSLLRIGTWEERFGLKVVLNSIDTDKIRVIERKNLDTMLTQTRTQTSRECTIREFNLDVQQILLKAVMGDPRDQSFGSRVSGSDALCIICQVTLENIENKCDEFLKMFQGNEYQKAFHFIDNICEVTNKKKNDNLNERLIERIKTKNTHRLFLAVPDIVDWTDIEGFKFRQNDNTVHQDIYLNDFLNTVRDINNLSCRQLKERKIIQVHTGSGLIEDRWSVYDCLNCEDSQDGKLHILTEGKWYEIDHSFVSQINNKVSSIMKYEIQLEAKKEESEMEYLNRLYQNNKINYALMDRKIMQYGGGQSKIEFCDIFTKNNELIHIKRYSGSSVLSHLFTQGLNCARALFDYEFRRMVNDKLPDSHKLDIEQRPKNYTIVFGIISEKSENIPENLPFFSKITLIRAMEELQQVIGFKILIAGIKSI